MLQTFMAIKETSTNRTPTLMTTFSTKTRARFGCWNIQTMYQASKLNEIIKEMKALTVLGLSLDQVEWLWRTPLL